MTAMMGKLVQKTRMLSELDNYQTFIVWLLLFRIALNSNRTGQ